MLSRRHSCRFLTLLIFLLATICLPTPASAWEGLIVRVVDGDTLIVTPNGVADPNLLGVSVRLYGIDAPKMSQNGGQESKAALEQLAHPGDTVTVITMESDKYDRLVGVVTNNGAVLNVEMLRSGHARIYEKYCRAVFCKEWKREENATNNDTAAQAEQ